MTRDEHIQWAKKRALELLEAKEYNQALISIMSDLRKHPETEDHAGILLTTMLMMARHLQDYDSIKKHIEGFN